ncbi:hypothetical protein MLD38_020076 [Melastoma candidum]|uniref:Uncharacterized protein n=1 Tax=Melastoma candidum TaxID=119954 RepID=A0ACB9QC68_9MYRT|nr:hypothetical protein MLD38_020076 [Melastoma candidum]
MNGAGKVFDVLSARSTSYWNKVISDCVSDRSFGKALGHFSRMLSESSSPDEGTYGIVLRACGGFGCSLDVAKGLHCRAVCHGFGTSVVVGNPLIDLYSKKGFVDHAQKVFNGLCYRDSVSWVAMISGFSCNGCELEAIRLFGEMRRSDSYPTPYVFSSLLSTCAKIEHFKMGEQVHGLVYKMGFFSHVFVCNALVTLYSHSGNWIFAEDIFAKTKMRDRVTYNALISGLSQLGFSGKALKLFEAMRQDLLKPDSITIASLICGCTSSSSLHEGKQLHSFAVKEGISGDITIEGSLLDMYVKCCDITAANDFFLDTQKQSVVLWNLMLVAFGQIGYLTESVRILKELHAKDVPPNELTYPSILKTCTSLGARKEGEQIHSLIIKHGFHHSVYVGSVLIDMYAKNGELPAANRIFRRVAEEDIASWTSMIAGYVQHDMFGEAFELFREMQNRGIQLDSIVFSSVINACAGLRITNQARQIQAQCWVSGYQLDLSVRNALVSLYARCGRIEDAFSAFHEVDLGDTVPWNALISGFVDSGHNAEALQVFTRMNKSGIPANLYTFCSSASAAANLADIVLGKQIHSLMIRTGIFPQVEASNVLIALYAKCGVIKDAEKQFDEMPEKNVVSLNAMITGYSHHGHGEKAINLFNEMIDQGMKPNDLTFLGVLSACSHVGLVDEGLKYFKSLKEQFALVPKPEHYACVVDLLGRAGHLTHAKTFIEEMPIKPGAMVWRTFLSACIVHKDVELGEFAAQRVQGIEPEDSAAYVLQSNMYAHTNRWDNRDGMRNIMKQRGFRKQPGHSWIDVGDSVHPFLAECF